MVNLWVLIVIAAASNVVLNHSLRLISRGVDLSSSRSMVSTLFVSPFVLVAFFSGALLVGSFMIAIRHYSLSLTYTAVTALAMVSLTVLDIAVQNEALSIVRIVGLTLIVIGLICTAVAS
jgi:multidrug transporter EmrE-like cation transporter